VQRFGISSGYSVRSGVPAPLPFPDSLCHRCVHLRVIESGKGSVFLMCQEPTLPKYGPQPVRACRRFTPK
jgi:hypothetical protein